jgi:ceramidase
MRPDLRRVLWTLLGTALSVPAVLALVAKASRLTDGRAATCMPDHCFCEQIRAAAVRQPVNTWSSLAFVAAGFWMLGTHGGAGDSLLIRSRVHRLAFAAAVLLIGYGSAFYHATLSFAGQFFDVFGMYLLAVFIALYGWSRLRPLGDAALITVPAARRYVFALLILIGLVLEMRMRRRNAAAFDARYLAAAVLVLALGFVAWMLDITRLVCSPRGLLQGHALWHLAGAASAILIFLYYRSEARLDSAGR